ncbi:MAG: glycosyltransferase family 4 protein [Microscillaceae bacterium]|nr:glycosyltransferase family 4 protein [Microscillaceae bacterium]
MIHNGADIPETFAPLEDRPPRYILYFGALQSWQGLPVLLKAFDFLRDLEDLHLVICSANRPKFAKHYLKMIEKMASRERIHWHFQLAKRPLYQWVREAALTVAPLTECSRNLEQGCCPLKVLESMALGTPVVASDLPAVREIIATPELGYLVRPDRPAVLARALRILLEHPEKIAEMGKKAQEHIRQHFTWTQKEAELSAFYSRLLGQT